MAKIEVTCFARHNTQKGVTRSQDEWHAHHLTKIVKGEVPNGTFPLSVNGLPRTINAGSADLCLWEIARRFAEKILLDHPLGAKIVPVPNGSAVVGGSDIFRTLDLARRIAAKGAPRLTAVPLLRWKEDLGKAHRGEKQRDVYRHKQNLGCVLPGTGRIVLFDDVVTSGSQLEASRQILTEAGYSVLGAYSIIEILDRDARGDAFGFKVTRRDPMDIASLFDDL
jgi:hypothetical protein